MFILFLLISFVSAQCPIYTPNPLDILWPPTLSNDSEMVNNYLKIVITIPIVSNRTNFHITVNNCPTCSWIVVENNCMLNFISNISLSQFNPLLSDVNTIYITMFYQEIVSSGDLVVDRNITNVLSLLVYFDSVVTISDQFININNLASSYFTLGETVYISVNSSNLEFVNIQIGTQYLVLNGEITSLGYENNLEIKSNSFQFNIINLVNVSGIYEINVVFESNNQVFSSSTTFHFTTESHSNSNTKSNKTNNNKNNTNNILVIIIPVVLGAIIILCSIFIYYRINKNTITPV